MKVFKILIALALTVFLAVSCNKDEITTNSEQTPFQLSVNGEIHNEGLALVLDSYKSKSDWQYDEIYSSLRVFTKNLLPMINEKGKYSLNQEDMEEAIVIMDEILPQIVNNDTQELSRFMVEKGVSKEKIDALNSISLVLKGNFDSQEAILQAISKQEIVLKNKGFYSSDVEESVNLLKASLIYWGENADLWREIDYNGVTLRGFWDTVNGMAESDFWSFAVVTAVTFNPGAGVAAGCYGSAAKGIKDLVTGECC